MQGITHAPASEDGAQGRLGESYGASYARLYREHWWWRAREALVVRWVARLAAGRRFRTLDIGCGDGLAWPALERWCDCTGLEPDARLVSASSPRRGRILQAAFPGANVPGGPFDLVLMLDVLEHLQDESAGLAQVRDLLAPEGHLLLTVPALPALWSAHDVINGHYRRYRAGTLRAALEASGLTILRLRYMSAWTVIPLLARRFLFHANEARDSAFVAIPPRPLNAALRSLSVAEHALGDAIPPPIGSSLIALAWRAPAER